MHEACKQSALLYVQVKDLVGSGRDMTTKCLAILCIQLSVHLLLIQFS